MGAYRVDRSFPVTMMGTRLTRSSSRQSCPTLTRFGSSHKFIKVPMTIWLFTVTWVSEKRPTPASMSLMIKHDILPCLITSACAQRFSHNAPRIEHRLSLGCNVAYIETDLAKWEHGWQNSSKLLVAEPRENTGN